MTATAPAGPGSVEGLGAGRDPDPSALASGRRGGRLLGQLRRVLGERLRSLPGALSQLETTAARLRGADPESGRALTVLYVGGGRDLDYVRDLAFGSSSVETGVLGRGSTPLSIRRHLRRHATGADVVVVDTLFPAERLLVPGAYHRVPRWVKQSLPVAGAAGKAGSGARAWARRVIRRHGYRIALEATDEARLRFYRELYRPYLVARFGEAAILVDEDRFLREAASGAILRLHVEGEVLAGVLLRPAGDELQIVWFGARPDAAQRGFGGLADALDYAALGLARRGGFARLHFGASRPSLEDGILQYKLKWGTEIHPGHLPTSDLRFGYDPGSAAAGAFLRRARLLERRDGELREIRPDRGGAA